MGERPGPDEGYDAPDSRRSFLGNLGKVAAGAAFAGPVTSTLAGCEAQSEESRYNELFNSPTEKMEVRPEGGAEEDFASTIIGMRERAGWDKEYHGEFRKILRARNPEMISETYDIKPGIYEGVPVNRKKEEGKE